MGNPIRQYYKESDVLHKIIPLCLLLITVCTNSQVWAANASPPLTHKLSLIKGHWTAPELLLENMDGEIIDIKDLKGKVVIVNFWATWCPPCRREMSSLEHLYQTTSDKGVEVIAVNIGEDPDTVFPFMGNLEAYPNFQIVFDTEALLMDQWKVQGLPTTFIVDKEGNIIYKAVGGREFNHPKIRQTILELTK